jgi:RNA polymerase sigma factor (sigma-70 family)
MRPGRATSRQVRAPGAAQAAPRPELPAATLPEEPGPETAAAATGLVHPSRLRAVSDEEYADWDVAYRDNVAWVYRLMFAKVGSRPDAEDLTAEVFMKALRPLRLPAAAPAVRAYLLATCRTTLARHWERTFGQQVTTLPADVEDALAYAREDSAATAPRRAERILAALPERYRSILQLRYLDACSVAEAARELGISVGNAKVLQHRALRRASEVAALIDGEPLVPGEAGG